MKQVLVKQVYNGVIDNEWPEMGVYFEDKNVVIICDPYGSVDVRSCKPVEGEDVVLVSPYGESLLTDNPEFFIGLVMGGRGDDVLR